MYVCWRDGLVVRNTDLDDWSSVSSTHTFACSFQTPRIQLRGSYAHFQPLPSPFTHMYVQT